MAITSAVCTSFKVELLKGEHNFTASTGDFTQPTFFKDPKVYITTVGLFNDSNELLAVAKLSQPVLKSYSREALIKVTLDF